jgi:hypothetical protein
VNFTAFVLYEYFLDPQTRASRDQEVRMLALACAHRENGQALARIADELRDLPPNDRHFDSDLEPDHGPTSDGAVEVTAEQ